MKFFCVSFFIALSSIAAYSHEPTGGAKDPVPGTWRQPHLPQLPVTYQYDYPDQYEGVNFQTVWVSKLCADYETCSWIFADSGTDGDLVADNQAISDPDEDGAYLLFEEVTNVSIDETMFKEMGKYNLCRIRVSARNQVISVGRMESDDVTIHCVPKTRRKCKDIPGKNYRRCEASRK